MNVRPLSSSVAAVVCCGKMIKYGHFDSENERTKDTVKLSPDGNLFGILEVKLLMAETTHNINETMIQSVRAPIICKLETQR